MGTGRVRSVPGEMIARWEQGHHPRKTVRREAGERWFLQSPKQMVDPWHLPQPLLGFSLHR